jgi:acetylornithine deacetylase/succinyl-diaminopimelate desuccinylase-like protein
MKKTILWAALVLAGAVQAAERPVTLNADQKLFRSIYQELVEINTTDSVGSTTIAAQAMRQRLIAAGFAAGDIEVIEPFPRKGNLVMRFKGTGQKKPLLLLAHIDVVEAKRSDWTSDPFKLQEKDGYFTARGAIDDKAMAAAYISTLAQLKAEGFKPQRDIILALTGNEERGAEPSNGARWLLKNRRELLNAEFGINEGGRGEIKDGKPVAQILQIGEKSFVQAEFEATGPGGHSARPTPDNVIYDLADALGRLRQYQFPVRLNDAARMYFERSAPLAEGAVKADMLAVARGTQDAAVYVRLSQNPTIVGLLRTTCVATMVNAGHAPNALAQSAKAIVNCRLLPDEDFNVVAAQLKAIGGPKVNVNVRAESEPAPSSPLRPDVMSAVEDLTKKMWPGVPVIPTMGVSTTDSRLFREVGMPMYGVSGLFVDPDTANAHGLNERIGVQALYDGREFMYQLIKRLAR